MFDYLKLALVKPLEAIIIALCVGYLLMHVELFEVKKAMALVMHQQADQVKINEHVTRMNDTLIRVDENVKFNRARLEKLSP